MTAADPRGTIATAGMMIVAEADGGVEQEDLPPLEVEEVHPGGTESAARRSSGAGSPRAAGTTVLPCAADPTTSARPCAATTCVVTIADRCAGVPDPKRRAVAGVVAPRPRNAVPHVEETSVAAAVAEAGATGGVTPALLVAVPAMDLVMDLAAERCVVDPALVTVPRVRKEATGAVVDPLPAATTAEKSARPRPRRRAARVGMMDGLLFPNAVNFLGLCCH